MDNIKAELERMDFLMRYTTMMLEGIQSSDLTNEQMLDFLYQQYMKTIALFQNIFTKNKKNSKIVVESG